MDSATVTDDSGIADLIRTAENERPPDDRSEDHRYPFIYCDFGKEPLPALKPVAIAESNDQPSTSERIRALLRLLWADVEFWKLVFFTGKPHSKSEGMKPTGIVEAWRGASLDLADKATLSWYVELKYLLLLPQYPARVWKALVTATAERTKLFEILCHQEWRWLRHRRTSASLSLKHELVSKNFNKIIDSYIENSDSRVEMTDSLARCEFSPEALKAIKAIANRLAADAQWCIKHPGSIPAEKVKQIRGRPTQSAVIDRVEHLVELRRARHGLSDMEAVKALLGGDKEDDAIRKSAIAARELLWFRDGVEVGGGPVLRRRK